MDNAFTVNLYFKKISVLTRIVFQNLIQLFIVGQNYWNLEHIMMVMPKGENILFIINPCLPTSYSHLIQLEQSSIKKYCVTYDFKVQRSRLQLQ